MPESDFHVGEPVLCYFGTGIYDAKVMAVHPAINDEPTQYQIHYTGWKKSWDERVPVTRLLRRDEDGLQIKAQVDQELSVSARREGAKRKGGGDEGDKPQRAGGSSRANMRRRLGVEGLRPGIDGGRADAAAPGAEADAPSADAEGNGAAGAPSAEADADAPAVQPTALQLQIPQQLKIRLVSDWEAVTREHKLVPLPRNPTVAQILDDFVAAKSRRSSHARLYEEVRAGVATYFQQALGQALLYRYERKQFDDLGDSPDLAGRPVDQVYGAEHLLRLLVKLPDFLEATLMEPDQQEVLQAKVHELLKFVQKNHASLFTAAYATPPKEYIDWWEASGATDTGVAAPAAGSTGKGKAPAA